MGTVTVQKETTKDPIKLIGYEAGVCWEADISDDAKNYKRGINCLEAGHGRTWEYPQVYMVIEGYSARVIRELYTHIGGSPTRLQASTRYVDYQKGFDYVVPPSIEEKKDAQEEYYKVMHETVLHMQKLEALGIPREDIAMILPLGMTTKIVFRTNLRNLVDMSHQRLCSRAYWEFRNLMRDMMKVLSEYSDEWKYLVDNYFKPKCEITGNCVEKNCCGRKPAHK